MIQEARRQKQRNGDEEVEERVEGLQAVVVVVWRYWWQSWLGQVEAEGENLVAEKEA